MVKVHHDKFKSEIKFDLWIHNKYANFTWLAYLFIKLIPSLELSWQYAFILEN